MIRDVFDKIDSYRKFKNLIFFLIQPLMGRIKKTRITINTEFNIYIFFHLSTAGL